MRLLIALLGLLGCAFASQAWAGDRYAVVIGHNDGDVDEVTLRYAEDDALKVFETLRDVGGFAATDMSLLVGESVETVRAGLAAMNARVRADSGAVLVVYFSGHADEGAVHLGGEHLPSQELSDLVAGSAARFRVLVVDACRSGALTRRKGGVPDRAIVVDATAPGGAEGLVILTASAAGEDAQESDLLRGSFFTHHWVSGLRGAADLDDDGEVTLDESYRHAFTNTVRQSSATLAGTQHPTYRYDVSGAGSVVLSRPRDGRRGGLLRFPSGIAFLVFDDSAAGKVVAELPAEAPARTLRVEAGSYFLRGRSTDALYEGVVNVAAQEARAVGLSELERIDYARLVRKGAGVRAASHAVSASWATRTSLHSLLGVPPAQGVRVADRLALRYVNVDVAVGGFVTGASNRFVVTQEREAFVDVGLSHTFDLPFVSVGAGGFVGGSVIQQTFTTPGVAPDRVVGAANLGLRGSAAVPLPLGFFVGVDVEGVTSVFQRQLDDGVAPEAQLLGRAAIGVGFEF